MRPHRIGAAFLLGGTSLVGVGLAAVWIIVPLAGAGLTIALGAGLVALGYRTLLRTAR